MDNEISMPSPFASFSQNWGVTMGKRIKRFWGTALASVVLLGVTGLGGTSALAAEETVEIPDPALRECLQENLNSEEILLSELEKITTLGCFSSTPVVWLVKDLTGIEHVKNLRSLLLYTSGITDFSSINFSANDAYVRIQAFGVSTITGLRSSVNGNYNIGGRDITDARFVSELDTLDALTVYSSELTDLTPFETLGALPSITLDVIAAEELPAFPAGSTVNFSAPGAQFSDLSPLTAAAPTFESLDLHDNQISDVGPISNWGSGKLDLTYNRITDPSPLNQSPGTDLNLAFQVVPMPSAIINVQQDNPGRLWDGTPLVPFSLQDAVIDQGTGDWSHPNPGSKVIHFDAAAQTQGRADSGRAFSGMFLQEVLPKPSGLAITKDPADQTVVEGKPASFISEATAVLGTNTVQWEQSNDGEETWTPVAGATAPTLTIPQTGLGQNGTLFRAVWTNDHLGDQLLSESALLTVTKADVDPEIPNPDGDGDIDAGLDGNTDSGDPGNGGSQTPGQDGKPGSGGNQGGKHPGQLSETGAPAGDSSGAFWGLLSAGAVLAGAFMITLRRTKATR